MRVRGTRDLGAYLPCYVVGSREKKYRRSRAGRWIRLIRHGPKPFVGTCSLLLAGWIFASVSILQGVKP